MFNVELKRRRIVLHPAIVLKARLNLRALLANEHLNRRESDQKEKDHLLGVPMHSARLLHRHHHHDRLRIHPHQKLHLHRQLLLRQSGRQRLENRYSI